MGRMVDGKWVTETEWAGSDGEFRRQAVTFRGEIEEGGQHPPEAGRYHLYISHACPWAHRTLIFRKLKGLEDAISLSVVDPYMGANGWEFGSSEGCIPDPIHGAKTLHEVYTKADPHYTGRVTVPVLWDREHGTIVNNESSELIRMFDAEFDSVAERPEPDFYPEPLRAEIDEINAFVYPNVNNGVYRCGFATTQEAYEEAFGELFAALDDLEGRLGKRRYLAGDRITEADWRLFTTLVRFDAVYVGHFKCNRNRIADMPNLQGYLRELYQVPGVAETVNMTHIKRHYYESHDTINPTRVVPVGPEIDFTAPHGRDRLGTEAA